MKPSTKIRIAFKRLKETYKRKNQVNWVWMDEDERYQISQELFITAILDYLDATETPTSNKSPNETSPLD